MTMLLPALCLMSCEDKVDRDVTWPEWASRPIIGTAAVSAETGSVVAGSAVNFHAEVSDEIRNAVDYIVDYRCNDHQPVAPSSILKIGMKGEIEIIRK